MQWIRRYVTPLLSFGGTSHVHIKKTGNMQGVGVQRMAGDKKLGGIAKKELELMEK